MHTTAKLIDNKFVDETFVNATHNRIQFAVGKSTAFANYARGFLFAALGIAALVACVQL